MSQTLAILCNIWSNFLMRIRQHAYRKTMKKLLLFVFAVLLLTGCSTFRNESVGNVDFKSYKRVFIEPNPSDEFGIYQGIFWEMKDIGLTPVAEPSNPAKPGDLKISFISEGGWDLTRYLQSFQINFIDVINNQVMMTHSFYAKLAFLGVRDRRLEAAFDEIRSKNGLPPTKQFSNSAK